VAAAVRQLDASSGPVKLVAMADVFADRIQAALRQLKSRNADRVDVAGEHRFTGLDAFQQLLQVDLDVVILATPPGFRPLHLEAAVAAGKHVFMEKPVAVDSPGVRRVLRAGSLAQRQGTAVAVGLQHRHEQAYQETIAQLHSGLIGNPVAVRLYRNAAALRPRPRQPRQTELEHQLRNWAFFSWLSGDQIVERHVQNLDVANWVLQGYPVEANAQGGLAVDGGRQRCGQVYDQFFSEYTYAGGVRVFSQCRQVRDCWNNVSEHIHCSEGHADISGGKIYDRHGQRIWQTKTPRGGSQQQQYDFIAALRHGMRPNETEYAAQSTLTAIMGRMAAYTGHPVSWQEAFESQQSLADVDHLVSLDDSAPVLPDRDGKYPLPMPGRPSDLDRV
jgi:predicted dehydrogenase